MKTFTDNAGRSWTVEVNVSAIKRARTLAGVDLLEGLEGSFIERFSRDPILLVDALYAVCKPQADERSVTDEEFGSAMAGDAIDHATQALLEELVSFSPSPRDRRALGQVLATTRRVMEKARDLIDARLESGAIEEAADRALAQAAAELEGIPGGPIGSSGSAPESSASIPATSPCGSSS